MIITGQTILPWVERRSLDKGTQQWQWICTPLPIPCCLLLITWVHQKRKTLDDEPLPLCVHMPGQIHACTKELPHLPFLRGQPVDCFGSDCSIRTHKRPEVCKVIYSWFHLPHGHGSLPNRNSHQSFHVPYPNRLSPLREKDTFLLHSFAQSSPNLLGFFFLPPNSGSQKLDKC